jgi:tripartite-type tricarboxylate transporter receptor subunit TctC
MHPNLSTMTLVTAALMVVAFPQLQSTVAAADYPTRNIELVIPYVPGGAVDAVARSLARGLGERLGVSVVVINRGGAGTIVGTQTVARASPDGYTLMLTSVPFVTNPSFYNKLPYAQSDFTPIMAVANSPSLLTVNAKLPANNLSEFIAYVKARPGQVNYASYGNGTSSHLAALQFEAKTGAQMQHIPYKGGGPASIAVITNEVQLVFATPTAVLGAIEAKQLKALAMAAPERIMIMPTVPTFQEQGLDYQNGAWFGLFAPAGTPADIVKRIHTESAAYLSNPDIRKSLHDIGLVVTEDNPEQFARFITNETVMWRDLLTKLAIPKQ